MRADRTQLGAARRGAARRASALVAALCLTAGCAPTPPGGGTGGAPLEGPGVRTESGAPRGERTDSVGAFRTVCTLSHHLFDDPIVHPRAPGAAHQHAFFGATSTDAWSTTGSLRAGGTTCPGGSANRSAYWAPAMLDGHGVVPPRRVVTYYKSGYGGVAPSQVRPMPDGLRMVAGRGLHDDGDTEAWLEHTSWSCVQLPQGDHTASVPRLPSCAAGWDVVLTVEFPQCWDGTRLDSPDHRSHMAYPDPAAGGCPASHRVPLPAITQNFHWPVRTDTSTWRLSSDHAGMRPGHSAHADWWNGWDRGVVAVWMRHCVNAGLDCRAEDLGDGRRLV